MTEQTLKVQIHGCLQANEAEIGQAVENALSNLRALAEGGDIEFAGPEDMAHVAEQMIRASMDRLGRAGGLSAPLPMNCPVKSAYVQSGWGYKWGYQTNL